MNFLYHAERSPVQLIPEQVQETKMKTAMRFAIIVFLIVKASIVFSQGSSAYECNLKLIHTCDSQRLNNEEKRPLQKINYKKMLKRDRPVVMFLNIYHSDSLSLQGLRARLTAIGVDYFRSFQSGDTVECLGIVQNGGLVSIQLRYSFIESQQKLVRRFYHISINNTTASDDQPMNYHYKIFKMLNFCLGRKCSCYEFEEDF